MLEPWIVKGFEKEEKKADHDDDAYVDSTTAPDLHHLNAIRFLAETEVDLVLSRARE